MQKNNFTLLCLARLVFATFAGNLVAEEVPQEKIDLGTAKKYAVTHNYGITALRHEMDEIKSRGERTRSPFLPKFGVAGGVEAQNSTQSSEAVPVAYAYGSYNLFNGYRDTYRKDISRDELEKAKINLANAEFLVGLEVEEVFHAYLFKRDLIELKDNEIALNEVHQKLVRQTQLRGANSETDVMEFQLKDSTLKSELVALKQELEDARSNLKRLLGEEIGGNIQPVGKMQHQHIKGSLMEALAKIQSSSQTVKSKATELSIAKTESKIANARWLPEINLEARAGYLNLSERPDGNIPQAAIALVAKMDLYTGGDTHWESKEKLASALKVESQLKDEINDSIRKVEVGYRNLKVIETRADLERDNASFAKRYYNSVLSEYKRGAKNSSDLSNASEKLSQTQARKLSLEFDFIRERIAVEKNLGSTLAIELITQSEASNEKTK